MSPAVKWIEAELHKLDLEGRDELRTHLITQEIPFWLRDIRDGKSVEKSEVDWFIRRRGFNAAERRKFRALAAFFNSRAEEIRSRFAPVVHSI